MHRGIAVLPLALAGLAALGAASGAEPVFRYKHAVIGGSAGPGTGVPETPDTQPPASTDPADPATPVTHLRVTFHFVEEQAAALREMAFQRGSSRVAPVEFTGGGGEAANSPALVDASREGDWVGADGTVSASFVYAITGNVDPDRLRIVSSDTAGPTGLEIERSPDGVSYHPVVAYSGEDGWTAGETRVYPFALREPPAEAGDARKFWRIAVERWNPDGSYPGIGELVFLDADAKDVTTGGRFGTDHTEKGLLARLFDKSTSTGWMGGHRKKPAASFWYEFEEPTAIASIDLTSGAGGAPQIVRIESSDDGRVWRPEARYLGQAAWSSRETRNYPVGFAKPEKDHHQFWRVRNIEGNRSNGSMGLNDLDLLLADGTAIHRTGVVEASSEYSSLYVRSWAADGANKNPWIPAIEDADSWIGYTLQRPAKIETVSIRADGANSPRTFVVEASDDGIKWIRKSTHYGQGTWGNYERRDFAATRADPVAAPGEFRYWRVAVEEAAGQARTSVSMREVDFRIGGSSLVGRGVPTASSEANNSNTAAQAFDGAWDNAYVRPWVSADLPAWVGYEFDRPLRPDEVAIFANGVGGPGTFTIEGSNDGTTWVPQGKHWNQGDWSLEWRSFKLENGPQPVNGEARFWRVETVGMPGADAIRWREVAFRTDGTSLHSGGISRATSESTSSRSSESAFDGSTSSNSYWQAGPTDASPAIWYGFASPVRPTELALTANGATTTPHAFAIRSSNDGVTWRTVESYGGAGNWAAGETRVFPIPRRAVEGGESYAYRVRVQTRQAASMPTAEWSGPSLSVRELHLLDDVTRTETRVTGTPVKARAVARLGSEAYDASLQRVIDGATNAAGTWVAPAGVHDLTIRLDFALPTKVEDFFPEVSPGCNCDTFVALDRLDGNEWATISTREWKLERLTSSKHTGN